MPHHKLEAEWRGNPSALKKLVGSPSPHLPPKVNTSFVVIIIGNSVEGEKGCK